MNKFEPVSSLWPPDVTTRRGLYRRGLGPVQKGPLHSEAKCIIGNGHMGHPPLTEWQTDMTENITFPQLRLRAVKKV